MRHIKESATPGDPVCHTIMFDDPVELVSMVCEAGAAGRFNRHMRHPFDMFGDVDKWYGRRDLMSWEGVAKKSAEVWQPGLDRVRTLIETLGGMPFVPPRDLRRKATWRDDGEGDFDLDRFVAGREAWRGPKKRDVIGRQFLTFVVDVAADHMTSADAMYWRTAVAIAAAETLEQFGYGVEVIAAINLGGALHPPGRSLTLCDQQDHYEHQQRILCEQGRFGIDRWQSLLNPVDDGGVNQDVFAGVYVKRADDPIDMGALTSVCSPWFFRIIFFGLLGLVPGCIPRLTMGHPVEIEEDRLDEATGPAAGDRVYLSRVWTLNAAQRKLQETLRQYADADWLADHPTEGSL